MDGKSVRLIHPELVIDEKHVHGDSCLGKLGMTKESTHTTPFGRMMEDSESGPSRGTETTTVTTYKRGSPNGYQESYSYGVWTEKQKLAVYMDTNCPLPILIDRSGDNFFYMKSPATNPAVVVL